MNRFLSLIFALSLLLAGCGRSSSTEGGGYSPTRWESFPVPLYADSLITQDVNADSDLHDAMNFWEQKAGKQLFDFRGAYNGTTFSGDASDPTEIFVNTILLQNPWPFAQNVVGKTHLRTRSNLIEHGLILLDKNTSFCTGDCSLPPSTLSRRKLMAHELGHFLGLSHVNDENNIMNPEITIGGKLDNLSVDSDALNSLTN